jgi:hypothetical protein
MKLNDFQDEVESLAIEIWIQVISLTLRKQVQQSIPGKVTFSQNGFNLAGVLVIQLGLWYRALSQLFQSE